MNYKIGKRVRNTKTGVMGYAIKEEIFDGVKYLTLDNEERDKDEHYELI